MFRKQGRLTRNMSSNISRPFLDLQLTVPHALLPRSTTLLLCWDPWAACESGRWNLGSPHPTTCRIFGSWCQSLETPANVAWAKMATEGEGFVLREILPNRSLDFFLGAKMLKVRRGRSPTCDGFFWSKWTVFMIFWRFWHPNCSFHCFLWNSVDFMILDKIWHLHSGNSGEIRAYSGEIRAIPGRLGRPSEPSKYAKNHSRNH